VRLRLRVALTSSEFDARISTQGSITAPDHLFARARVAREISKERRDGVAALRAETRQFVKKQAELTNRLTETTSE
jgi:hypothetical protein